MKRNSKKHHPYNPLSLSHRVRTVNHLSHLYAVTPHHQIRVAFRRPHPQPVYSHHQAPVVNCLQCRHQTQMIQYCQHCQPIQRNSNSSGFASKPLCLRALQSFSFVFLSTCTREELLTTELPPVNCSLIVLQNRPVKVPDYFVFTSVTELTERPTVCVVKAAIHLLREERKLTNENGALDIESEDTEIGVAIGRLGIFCRTGLGRLEWIGDVAEMQYNVHQESWRQKITWTQKPEKRFFNCSTKFLLTI